MLDQDFRNFIKDSWVGSRSLNVWHRDRIERYLRTLKSKKPDIGIRIGVTSAEMNLGEMFGWIEEADPHLDEFSKYHHEFENNRKKGIGIYKLPASLKANLETIRENIPELQTHVIDIIRGNEYATKVETSIAQSQDIHLKIADNRPAFSTLKIDDLQDAQLKATLLDIAKSRVSSAADLEYFSLRVKIPSRYIQTVKYDLENMLVTVSSDSERLTPEQTSEELDTFQKIHRMAINLSLKYLRIDEQSIPDHTMHIIRSPEIRVNTLEPLLHLQESQMIAIPVSLINFYTAGVIQEKNTTDFLGQNINALYSVVKAFYADNESLDGFFGHHSDLDPNSAATLYRRIRDLEGVEELAGLLYLFFIRPRKVDDPHAISSDPDHVQQNVVDFVKIQLDLRENVVKTVTKEITEEQNEALSSQLYKLIQGA